MWILYVSSHYNGKWFSVPWTIFLCAADTMPFPAPCGSSFSAILWKHQKASPFDAFKTRKLTAKSHCAGLAHTVVGMKFHCSETASRQFPQHYSAIEIITAGISTSNHCAALMCFFSLSQLLNWWQLSTLHIGPQDKTAVCKVAFFLKNTITFHTVSFNQVLRELFNNNLYKKNLIISWTTILCALEKPTFISSCAIVQAAPITWPRQIAWGKT